MINKIANPFFNYFVSVFLKKDLEIFKIFTF